MLKCVPNIAIYFTNLLIVLMNISSKTHSFQIKLGNKNASTKMWFVAVKIIG